VTATIETGAMPERKCRVLIQTPSAKKLARVVKREAEGTGRVEMPVAPDKIVVTTAAFGRRMSGNNVYDVLVRKTITWPRLPTWPAEDTTFCSVYWRVEVKTT